MTSFSVNNPGQRPFGICLLKENGSHAALGVVHGDGKHYARCEVTDSSNATRLYDGNYELAGAYDTARPYIVEAGAHSAVVRERDIVLQEVQQLIFAPGRIGLEEQLKLERATGLKGAFGALWAGLKEADAVTLERFISSDRFVHAPKLNALGMHLLRCLLAERITDERRREKGLHLHKDYDTYMRDGFLLKDFTTMSNDELRDILIMVSGYEAEDIPDLIWELRAVSSIEGDPNLDLHVDTFHPSWKVWLYGEDIEDRHGPFTFVFGSHANSEKKLRWLYKSSNDPPPYGPSSYGSFRIGEYGENGGNPTALSREDETSFGLPERQGVTGKSLMLLIADVSGLHARGGAEVGQIRRTFVLHGHDNDGGLPRRNPFSYNHRS
jgi:hypothetical protein